MSEAQQPTEPDSQFKDVPGASSIPAEPDGDARASEEATAFSEGDLEQRARVGAHRRREKFRDAFSGGAIFLFWMFIAGVALAAFAAAWHVLMPEECGWLSKSQLRTVHTFLTSGVLATAANQYISNNAYDQK